MQLLVCYDEQNCRRAVIQAAEVLDDLVKKVEIIHEHPFSNVDEHGRSLNVVNRLQRLKAEERSQRALHESLEFKNRSNYLKGRIKEESKFKEEQMR